MTLPLFALVLLGAAIHVGWNAVARSTGTKADFPWWTAVVGVVVLAPLFVLSRLRDPGPLDVRALRFALFSGALEAVYFVLLKRSYGRAELSLVYPLSRGVAPLFALLPARAWTGESLTAREVTGIAIVLVGALALARRPVARDDRGGPRDGESRRSGVALALAVGTTIAAYQLVDGVALRGAHAPKPVEYQFLLQVVLAALLTIAVARRGGLTRGALIGAWGSKSEARTGLRLVVFAGIAMQAAYLLILLALRDGKIPLVIAARSVGIPLSLVVGRFALNERLTKTRIVASLTIVAGVVLLVEW